MLSLATGVLWMNSASLTLTLLNMLMKIVNADIRDRNAKPFRFGIWNPLISDQAVLLWFRRNTDPPVLLFSNRNTDPAVLLCFSIITDPAVLLCCSRNTDPAVLLCLEELLRGRRHRAKRLEPCNVRAGVTPRFGFVTEIFHRMKAICRSGWSFQKGIWISVFPSGQFIRCWFETFTDKFWAVYPESVWKGFRHVLSLCSNIAHLQIPTSNRMTETNKRNRNAAVTRIWTNLQTPITLCFPTLPNHMQMGSQEVTTLLARAIWLARNR